MGLYLTGVAGTQNLGVFCFGVDPWFFTCRDVIYKRLDLHKDWVSCEPPRSLSPAVSSTVPDEVIRVWLGLKKVPIGN